MEFKNTINISKHVLESQMSRMDYFKLILPGIRKPRNVNFVLSSNSPVTEPCMQEQIPNESVLIEWKNRLRLATNERVIFNGCVYDMNSTDTALKIIHIKNEQRFVEKELSFLNKSLSFFI